jgi:hypothetical protein
MLQQGCVVAPSTIWDSNFTSTLKVFNILQVRLNLNIKVYLKMFADVPNESLSILVIMDLSENRVIL